MADSTASVAPQPLVIRSWPKIILMLPTLVVAIICCVFMGAYGPPSADAPFGTIHYVGLLFLVVLGINLTMVLYDLSLKGFIMVALLIAVLLLGVTLLDRGAEDSLWAKIGRALSFPVVANSSFYFVFSAMLLFNLAIAFVMTRFNYWKVERNEIIIHKGFMQEQERHPTAQTRFKLVIEDVVEYGIFGSGKLVFTFADKDTVHELSTVLFVRRKAKRLDDLLGRIAVTAQ